MAILDGTWANSYVVIETETGIYRAAYAPGPREEVVIAGPGDEKRAVKTPHLGGFALTVENNKLCIWYLELPAQVERRIETGVTCGQRVMAMLPAATGPIGPAGGVGPKGDKGDRGPAGPPGKDGLDGEDAFVDDETIDKIAARVWTLEAGPHAGISGTDLGTMAQQNIAYPLTQRQDVKVLELQREDEAVKGLKDAGFVPKGV